MLLSHRCTYALRMALALVEAPAGEYVPVHEISERLGTPAAFLSKTAQSLIGAGLLHSKRGVQGGVALARSPEAIRLSEIVDAIDGPDTLLSCILGLPDCGEAAPCPLHTDWAAARSRVRHTLKATTLHDAARGLASGEVRIADLTAQTATPAGETANDPASGDPASSGPASSDPA